MVKSVENYAKKKEHIKETAKNLFLESGYSSVSMDVIAKQSGFTKQTVYRYFHSKEELFKEVISGMGEKGEGYRFGNKGVLEELIRYAEEFIKAHMNHERLSLYRLVIAENSVESAIGKIFREVNQSRRKKPLIEYLRDRLSLPDPAEGADIFCAMLLYSRSQILIGARDIPDDYEIRDMAENAVKIFVNGVLGF